MMSEGAQWMQEQLSKSTADWRIAVTHFPPSMSMKDIWEKVVKQYPLDLIVTGHTHIQQLFLPKSQNNPMGSDFPIPYIVTGGGGGVSSSSKPSEDGHDEAYGFVDFTISRTNLKVEKITWGGLAKTDWIIEKTCNFQPRQMASNTAVLDANSACTSTKEALVV